MDLLQRIGNAIWSPQPRKKCLSCRAVGPCVVPKSAGGRPAFCSVECRDSWEEVMREW